MKIDIGPEDFGTICICAIRYCHGRMTYMPDLVRRIINRYLKNPKVITDKTLQVMINDCDFQRRMNLYGDECIDKPGWLAWEKMLLEEKERREKDGDYK